MYRKTNTTTSSNVTTIDGFVTRSNLKTTTNYEKVTISELLFFVLRISFLMMSVFFIFRYAIGNEPLSFSEFLNGISTIGYDGTTSYFDALLERLHVRDIFEFSASDTINLPIIGGLVEFLSNVLGLLVYVVSAIVSCLMYFVDLLDLIF